MKLQKILLLILLCFTSLLAAPNTLWNKQPIAIVVNKKRLQAHPHLLKNFAILEHFYTQRQNQPLWLSPRGIKGKKVMQLLAAIQKDVTLAPNSPMHREAKIIKQKLAQKHTNASITLFDIELTMLYYDFLQHTIYGEIDWKAFEKYLEANRANGIDSQWKRYPLHVDIDKLLSQENINKTLRQVTPTGFHYQQLLAALYDLYRIKWQGGWERLPAFRTLRKGQSSPMVSRLKRRLAQSGDYQNCYQKVPANYFGSCLEKAVKRFQKRHNVKADGIVGRGTQKLLNISVDSKIHTVLLNLDRIKWLPRNRMPRYIVVNIPEYMLHYYEYGRELKRLRVIVGDTKHPTPIFSDTLSYLTLNPYWKLPKKIIKKEVVPAMLKNPNYIKQHDIEMHETWEENSSLISTQGINWSLYLDESVKFPYVLMQRPGPKNALGRIKFKFPNKFSVYLHDTPNKKLFKQKRRAFSHGCIRLSNPFSLLESLAKDEPEITPERVNGILASKKKTEIDISKDLPIHLVYLTAWVDTNNQLIFGDDIYQYDRYQVRR
jgi:murein L,D-transpeptidase YcbB/YkuD